MNKIQERHIMPVYCPQCKASFDLPSFTESEKASIVELALGKNTLQAILLLRQLSGIELRDAKAVEMHITTRGICHRCKSVLPNSDANGIVCSKCNSLNLDW